MLQKFLESNDLKYRLLRTIAESVLAFLVANIDILFSGFTIPVEYKLVIMGVVVSAVSPILSALRTAQKDEIV